MNNFRDMFPSKYLKVADIDQTKKTTVTIKSLSPVSASVKNGSMGGYGDGPGDGQADVVWAMFFREFQKPIVFKRYQAEAVFASLNEIDPAKWIGRQVQIYAGSVAFGNNQFPKVLISPEPVKGQALPPAAGAPAPTQPQLPAGTVFVTTAIGAKNGDAFAHALKEQATNTDAYLAWLRQVDQTAYEATTGKELAEWPRGGIHLMQKFLKDYKASTAALAADEEIPF